MRIEDSLQVVFENCSDAVLVVHPHPEDVFGGDIIYVNGAFCSLTGFARQEIEGKSARSFVWGEIPRADRWKHPGAPARRSVVLNFRRKNSSEVQEPMQAWLIQDPEEGTDRVAFQQQAALPQDLPHAQKFRDQTHACVFTTDLNGKVTSWNHGAVKATGFSADEMLGQDIRVLCTSPGSKCLPDDIIPILLKDGSFDFRMPLRRKDGEISHLAFALSLLRDGSGVPSGFLSVSLDITDLSRHRKALQESTELLQAIQNLQRRSMSGGDMRAVLGDCLSTLLQITNSEHGFCGEVRIGGEGRRSIRADTIQTRSKDPDTLRFFEPYLKEGFEFRRPNSLIGYVVTHGTPVVTAAPSSDPRSIGLPEDHPPITSFAGLPLFIGEEMVGMVGLANRRGGYEEELLRKMHPLLDCCAGLIQFCRIRDKANVLAKRFQRGFENTRDALVIVDLEGMVVDWNPAAEKLFGATKETVVGTNFMHLGRQLGGIHSVIREKGYWEDVVTFRNRAGIETMAETSCFPITSDDTPLFMFVIRDITWRKQAEEALQEASCRFDAFAQNSRCAFWIAPVETRRAVYTSPALKTIAGLDPPLDPERWDKMIHPDDRAGFHAIGSKFFSSGMPVQHKYRIVLPDGRIRWIQSHAFPVRDARGEIYRFAGLLEDVTDYEEAVAKMHVALSEKEALLKEIHHRVKNNLQIISSLLRLQATSTRDPDSIAFLQESRNRVETIALLHEYLHQSDNLSDIDFSTYIKRLVTKLMSISSTAETVEVDFDLEPLTLDSQTTVLCGLILNELVSNSLRHAFPDGRKGKIKIELRTAHGKMVSMNISDDGVGLPKNFDLERVDTLGLRLVRRLTRQLGGTVFIFSERGVMMNITFPYPVIPDQK